MRLTLFTVLLAGCGASPPAVDAATCGSCHAQELTDWTASGHARSTRSPVYAALLPRVEAAWGSTARARCVACHQPGHAGDDTIGCASCHLAVGNREEANGALVVKEDAPIAGPHAEAETAPHALSSRPFFRSASLCGTCHEVRSPHLEEPTLSEYRASSRAGEDSCARCHLREGHRIAGLEPKWGAPADEQARGTHEARALLFEALSLEVVGHEVRLTNTGAAHAVPTGMISLRDVWVDVLVFDALGTAHTFSRVIELGAVLEREGAPVVLLTDATKVRSRSLAPGETRSWIAPIVGRVEARLRARAIRLEVLDALDLSDVARQVPVLE